MSQSEALSFDIAVVGGGATGFAAALTAAARGFRTAIFAPAATFPPGRTAALLQGSVELLSRLGVWQPLAEAAAPLRAIRIADSTRRLVRAPEILFHASEIGLPAFGYNVPNGTLVEALRAQAADVENLVLVPMAVEAVDATDASVRLQAGEREYSARLAIAADGSRSAAREAAGIAVRGWSYPQSALVTTLAIERPHGGVSTEFHTENGPFTLVPLHGDRVSLVWVTRPEQSAAHAALSREALSHEVERRAHSIHGAMDVESAPACYPLSAALADRFAARRTMLVGEAAHLFPPIGAQGLNLGFRDVAALDRVLTRWRDDPGAPEALAAYHAARQADVRARTLAIDLLNRSLLTDFIPVQAVRGIGVALLASVPSLRRALMRRGVAG